MNAQRALLDLSVATAAAAAGWSKEGARAAKDLQRKLMKQLKGD